MIISCCIAAVIIVGLGACHYAAQKENENRKFYNQKWYKDAAKEFEDDFYYPPASHGTSMNANGIHIRTSQHYRPVRHSTYSPSFDKLIPWFVEVKACYDGGCEKFLERYFGSIKKYN